MKESKTLCIISGPWLLLSFGITFKGIYWPMHLYFIAMHDFDLHGIFERLDKVENETK